MSSSLLELQHPTQADAPRIAELLAAFEEQMLGESEWNLEELESEWRDLQLDRDVWMVLDGDELVGYVALNQRNDVWEFDGYVSPHRFGTGVGCAIVEHAEAEARRRGSAVTRTAVLGGDEPAHRLLESRGFAEARRFYRMVIELAGPAPAPAWPDGLEVVPLDFEADHEAVHAAIDASFAEHWNIRRHPHETWLERQRERGLEDPWGWIVVRDGDEIAAVTAFERERFGMGWISDVGVLPAWRRRGLGEAMLHEAFGRFWEAGQRTVGLGVDAQNETGATRLYERVGMHVSWSATFFEKELA
jgi:mycothiol synthase